MATEAKAVLQTEKLEAVADRGCYSGEEILACHRAGWHHRDPVEADDARYKV